MAVGFVIHETKWVWKKIEKKNQQYGLGWYTSLFYMANVFLGYNKCKQQDGFPCLQG